MGMTLTADQAPPADTVPACARDCGTRECLTAWPVNGRAEYLCTGAHESPGQPYLSE